MFGLYHRLISCLSRKFAKKALRFLDNDYSGSYKELLKMSGKNTINIRRYRNLCIEIFKTVNNINPSFVKEIFRLRIMNCSNRYKLNLEISNPGKKGLPWSKSLELFIIPYKII